MADSRNEPPSLPGQGRVQEVRRAGLPSPSAFVPVSSSNIESVRKQFSVHEDGALAYRLQNEEFDEHYGMNRYHRRTVRDDIPVAKVVQTEEEIELQKERLRKLAALQAQAEADEIVARRINRQVQDEARRHEVVREIEDEELARQLQDKEKAKYEKYLEKKRERKLKKEREKLEQQLAKTTAEARLVVGPNGGGADQAQRDMAALRLQGASPVSSSNVPAQRVTPSGRIEDDGDFSDFFVQPDHQVAPEEWDQIQQQQDAELARLLQEQEHKRTKAEVDRSKLREIEMRDEQLAAIMQEQEKLKEKKYKEKRQKLKEQQKLERQQSEGLPLGASANMLSQMPADHNHHLYRRNSYTKSIEIGRTPVEPGPNSREREVHRGMPTSRSLGAERGHEEWVTREGREGRPQMPPPGSQNQGGPHRTLIEVHNPHPHMAPSSQPSSRRQAPPNAELSPEEAPEVMRWLQTQGADCDDDDPRMAGYLNNNNNNNSFNIATAIDPTYNRRPKHHEEVQYDVPQVKNTVSVSRSMPLPDPPVEWDMVKGSLRRLRGTLNTRNTNQADIPSEGDSSFEEGAMNGMQPVQGQKRSTMDNRPRGKTRRSSQEGAKGGGKKDSGNCKQQ